MVTFNNQLVGMNTNNRVYKYNGNFFEEIGNIGQSGLDIRATTDYLVVTSANHVFVFNPSFTQSAHIQSTQITAPVVTFSCATVINETIYIGTNENGILASTISNSTNSPSTVLLPIYGLPTADTTYYTILILLSAQT